MWIVYMWFPFILFRLALFSYALAWLSVMTREVPFYDEVASFAMMRVWEVCRWSQWLTTHAFLFASRPFSALMCAGSPVYALFMMNNFSLASCQVQQICHWKMVSRGFCLIRAFDVRLMILSSYQLYPSWSAFFTRSAKW